MSRCLVHLGLQLSIVPKIDSKHMPVKMSLKLPRTVSGTDAKPKTYKVQKYIWNTEKSQQYFDTCSSDDVSSLFKDAVGLSDVDIEAALSKFTDGITVCKKPLQSVKIKVALGLMVSVKINDASYGSD